MTDRVVFQNMVERAMQTDGRTLMRPVIEKELLHYDILFALDQENILDRLTFQGGTALRLCYGGLRFSEDLDFTGGADFSNHQLITIKHCLEKYLDERYGLAIEIKTPKDMSGKIGDIRVDVWQVAITTSPEKKDIPKQKIKIEIINIPSYSSEPRALIQNYDFLPSGYHDTLVMTESLDEIMADKLISLVNCTRYIRYRDIWDLRWLKQQGATLHIQFIKNKIDDYKITDHNFKLQNFLNKLQDIIFDKNFLKEMERFIPSDILSKTLKKEKFLHFLNTEIKSLLDEVNLAIYNNQ